MAFVLIDLVGEDIAMHWFILPFQRYAEFSGRSRRREYWSFCLLNMIVAIFCLIPVFSALTADNLYPSYDENAQFHPRSVKPLAEVNPISGPIRMSATGRSCEPFCSPQSGPATDAPEFEAFAPDEIVIRR